MLPDTNKSRSYFSELDGLDLSGPPLEPFSFPKLPFVVKDFSVLSKIEKENSTREELLLIPKKPAVPVTGSITDMHIRTVSIRTVLNSKYLHFAY